MKVNVQGQSLQASNAWISILTLIFGRTTVADLGDAPAQTQYFPGKNRYIYIFWAIFSKISKLRPLTPGKGGAGSATEQEESDKFAIVQSN